MAAAEAAAADDGLSEGIIRIKLIEYHGKAGCDAMGKNAIKNAKERRQGRHPELSAAGPWSLHLDSLGHYTVDIAPSIGDSSFCLGKCMLACANCQIFLNGSRLSALAAVRSSRRGARRKKSPPKRTKFGISLCHMKVLHLFANRLDKAKKRRRIPLGNL